MSPRRPTGLSRRHLLQGLGASLALPWLPSLAGRSPLARADGTATPPRVLFLYIPNGALDGTMKAEQTGEGLTLPPLFESLAGHEARTTVLAGLRSLDTEENPAQLFDPHNMPAGALWTAENPSDPEPAGLQAGRSIDQVLADALGTTTPLRSLELASEGTHACPTTLNCSLMYSVSYREHAVPVPRLYDARSAFERIFGTTESPSADPAERLRSLASRQRLMDALREDATDLAQTLGRDDRQRLDAYLTAVDALDRQLLGAEIPPALTEAVDGLSQRPELLGTVDLPGHVDVMSEMIALALACDRARVVSYMFGAEGSRHTFPFLGMPDEHHFVSHHEWDPDRMAATDLVSRWWASRAADLVDRLATTPDPLTGGMLLDDTLVVIMGGMGDPHLHDHRDIPVALVGANHLIPGDRYLDLTGHTLADLYSTLMVGVGLPEQPFGLHGTGSLTGILA